MVTVTGCGARSRVTLANFCELLYFFMNECISIINVLFHDGTEQNLVQESTPRCFLPCLSSIFMKFQRSSKSSKANASKLSKNMYNDVQCTYKQLLFFLFHHRYFTKDLFLEKTTIQQQLHQFLLFSPL